MQVVVNGLTHTNHCQSPINPALCVYKMVDFRFFSLSFLSFLSLWLCFRQTFVNGQLRLEGKQEEGKGKCPFDPFQRYSSLMVGEYLSQVLLSKGNKAQNAAERSKCTNRKDQCDKCVCVCTLH